MYILVVSFSSSFLLLHPFFDVELMSQVSLLHLTLVFELRCSKTLLPNQELSVLYGGPLSIMGENYPCMFPVCSATEIWHICNCLIYREKLDLYAKRLIYREKERLYAERNDYFSY